MNYFIELSVSYFLSYLYARKLQHGLLIYLPHVTKYYDTL